MPSLRDYLGLAVPCGVAAGLDLSLSELQSEGVCLFLLICVCVLVCLFLRLCCAQCFIQS